MDKVTMEKPNQQAQSDASPRSRNIWVDVVSKLIELTQHGELRWESRTPSPNEFQDRRVDIVYEVFYKGRAFRVFRETKKVTEKQHFPTLLPPLVAGEQRWASLVSLELIDAEGKTMWRLPDVRALDDLLSAIQFQVADVDGFVDAILSA